MKIVSASQEEYQIEDAVLSALRAAKRPLSMSQLITTVLERSDDWIPSSEIRIVIWNLVDDGQVKFTNDRRIYLID